MSGRGGGSRAGGGRRFGVLGTLLVEVAGQPRPVTAGQSRVVLAALLLNGNRPVGADKLVEYLWDDPPSSARTALHSIVMRLRRAVGDQQLIRTDGPGYVAELRPGELDVDDFRSALGLADLARARAEPEVERAHLAAAVGLWRGRALADVPSAALRRGEAAALEELWLQARCRRIDVDLGLGRHARAVSELRELTQEHPLREALWAQLMTALYRCGRQAEALAAYQDVRRALVEQLGVEPGDHLREVHQAILTGDPSLQAPPAPAAVLAAPRRECQLPPVSADFVGRAAERDRLVSWLTPGSRSNVVVLSGLPGVGKSALAVRAAHSLRPAYPDGQWYIRLNAAGAGTGGLARTLRDLLSAAGVPPAEIPPGLHARIGMLRAQLADRRVLLILDDAVEAGQVECLLPGTPGCAVLVTSRRSLSVLPGAHHHRLPPLTAEDGASLLGGVLGEQRVAREPAAFAELVEVCGGLPLALRILAARLGLQPTLSLGALAARLRDERRRLDELAVGGLAVRASLDVSYAGLDGDGRKALRGMGLLPRGPFTASALGLFAQDGDGERLVEALTEASLLDPVHLHADGEPRYRPHDLVALYAQELAVDRAAGQRFAL